jgi:hypothetical protein
MASFKAGSSTYGGAPKTAAPKNLFPGKGGIAAGRVPRAAVAGLAPAAPYMETGPQPTAVIGGVGAPSRDYAAEAAANPDVWKDSTYNTTLANLLSQKSAGETTLDAAERRASEDKSKNLGLLQEGRGKSKAQTTESANSRGLFYSGALGKQLGEVDTDYGRREGDVNTAFARGEEDRASSRSGLQTAYDQAARDASSQALDRWIAAAQGTESPSTPTLDTFISALNRWNVGSKSNARGR